MLLDEEEEAEEAGIRLLSDDAMTDSLRLRSLHRSATIVRPRLAVLNFLLQLARNLTPSVRGSFVESVIEHDCIDSLARILHSLSRIAHLDGSPLVRRMCEWLLPAVLSTLAALLSSCPDSFRSYVVESHALHSPTHSSSSGTTGNGSAPSPSLVDSLLTAVAHPACAGSSGGGAVVAFLRQLCDGDEDDSSGEHVQQLQRLCIEGTGMAELADSLRCFSLHPRPMSVRRSAVWALDWLTFVAGKFKAVAVSRYATSRHLAETCAHFLTRLRSPLPSSECGLLAAPSDVVGGVLRLLGSLVRCHRLPLIDALIEANVFQAVLQSVLSSAYLTLHSTSLLTSAALELLNQLTPVTHLPAVRSHLLQLQPHMQHIAHIQGVSQLMQRCHAYQKQHAQQHQLQQLHKHDQPDSSSSSEKAERGRRKRRVRLTEDDNGHSKRSRRHSQQQQERALVMDEAVDEGKEGRESSSREGTPRRSSSQQGSSGHSQRGTKDEIAEATETPTTSSSSRALHRPTALVSPDYDSDDDEELEERGDGRPMQVDGQQQRHELRVQRPYPEHPASPSTLLSPSSFPPRRSDEADYSFLSVASLPAAAAAADVAVVVPPPPSDPSFDSAREQLLVARRQQREAEDQRADLLANMHKRAAAGQQQHTTMTQIAPRLALSISLKRPSFSFALNGASPLLHSGGSAQMVRVIADSSTQRFDEVDSTSTALQQAHSPG